MCSTKVKNYLKRYLSNKPHKFKYKIYILCGSSRLFYKIESETWRQYVCQIHESDLGAFSDIARIIFWNQNFKLYFDNKFTSLRLPTYLSHEGIFSMGIIGRNRIPNCELHTEKYIMKKNGGYSEEVVCCLEQ